jgi:hypothetical protein
MFRRVLRHTDGFGLSQSNAGIALDPRECSLGGFPRDRFGSGRATHLGNYRRKASRKVPRFNPKQSGVAWRRLKELLPRKDRMAIELGLPGNLNEFRKPATGVDRKLQRALFSRSQESLKVPNCELAALHGFEP